MTTEQQSSPLVVACQIVNIIQRARCDLSTEKRLQADIENLLMATGIEFVREARLNEQDIPDFLIKGGVVIECKMRGAKKMDVYRQLCRYAEHSSVTAIVLASNMTMGMPNHLNSKPVIMASLSRGWL